MHSPNPHQDQSLSPAQRLLFWRIAAAGGRVWLKSISPLPSPAVRRALEKSGLALQELSPDPSTGRPATVLEITGPGWEWARHNMGGSFANTPATAETLSLILEALALYLDREGLRPIALFTRNPSPAQGQTHPEPGSLLHEPSSPHSSPAPMIDAGLVRQIVTLSSGRPDIAIPLKNLRRLLDIQRLELDASLHRLRQDGRIELVPAPNPRSLSHEDRDAVLFDENGRPYHQVKLARHLEVAY